MKALVYHGPEDIRLQETADVLPGADQVKLRVRATGICGSDVHGYAGITGRRLAPMIMGHEFAGEVAEAGDAVTSLQVGDRVVPFPIIACGRCSYCHLGQENMCSAKKLYGVLDMDGSMTEYICVNEKQVIKLDSHVDYAEAAMVEPLAVALHGVRKAGDLGGKNVLIVGAGTIGLFTLALVKLARPAHIFISDLIEHRLSAAKQMGADTLIKADQTDPTALIQEMTGLTGVDCSIECVGAASTARQALQALKTGGKSIWIGNSAKMIETNMQEIVTRELTVSGSYLYTRDDFLEIIELLKQQQLNIKPVISRRISLEEGPAMFDTLFHAPADLIKVIIQS